MPTEPRRAVALGELLEKDQIDRVKQIFAAAAKSRAGDQQLIQSLKEYLRALDKQLQDKGVLPEFLAYHLIQCSRLW